MGMEGVGGKTEMNSLGDRNGDGKGLGAKLKWIAWEIEMGVEGVGGKTEMNSLGDRSGDGRGWVQNWNE